MRLLALFILLITSTISLAQSAGTSPADPVLAKLMSRLAADDPKVRDLAARDILVRGRAARPALADGINGDDPQIRLTASELILKLPFDSPEDPLKVARMLETYGQFAVPSRVNFPKAVAELGGEDAPAILLRLMREEPSDEVRWVIVTFFRKSLDRKLLPPLDAYDLTSSRSPNIALAAWAHEASDPKKAMALYRRCVEAELREPTPDHGDANFVFQALFRNAMLADDYDAAADVWRAQYSRRPGPLERSEGGGDRLNDLFALHATLGPLKGFTEDLARHPNEIVRPQILYALGRLYERRMQQPLMADALYRAAFAAGGMSLAARDGTAEFLLAQGWDELAKQEFLTILSGEPGARNVYAANANLRLAILLARQGDDFGAAENGRAALERLAAMGGTLMRTHGERRLQGKEAEDFAWAEVHWRYFRAARDKGDRAEMDKHLTALLTFDPSDDQIASDIIPDLLERGRDQEADRLFAKAYAEAKGLLDQHPEEALRMNKLAWLCARSRRKLDEALKLIEAAMQAKPNNYAYLDTAAEVHFQLGNFEKAVELEKRAIELRPDDTFLTTQLKRFREAVAKGK